MPLQQTITSNIKHPFPQFISIH